MFTARWYLGPLAVLAAATLFAAGATLADNERGAKAKSKHHGWEGPLVAADLGARFVEPQRLVAKNYYLTQIKAGNCPPGLAKKNNGCLPPGQAKKWQLGRTLSPGVIFYELPAPLLAQLGPPPDGYRYARIGNDLLLLTVGSGMVVDAITDLGRDVDLASPRAF